MSSRDFVLVLAMLGIGLGTAGCSGPEYDHLEVNGVEVKSNFPGELDVAHLTLTEGDILKAHMVAWNDDKKPMVLSFRAQQADMVQVIPIVGDRLYAFLGNKTGQTQLEILADDKVVVRLDVTISEQPTLTP